MILRRVITHFRKQEWTAIALDFFIVVLGVFIGLQVQEWSGRQADRRTEGAYLQRLHDDIVALSAETAEEAQSASERNAFLEEVLSYFESRDGMPPARLGAQHCSAVARSHIYASGIVTPPTIRELFEAGEVGLIQDHELRSAIVRFEQVIEAISQLRTDLQIDRRLLAREYPAYISLGLRRWEDSQCQFGAMAKDQAFINDFADGFARESAFMSNVVGRLSELQHELHLLLDTTLAIRHGTEDGV